MQDARPLTIGLVAGESSGDNLGVAPALHAAGLRTLQYVSPQVWAWRRGRAARMAGYLDLVLCLLPFLGALIYIVSRPKVTAQDVQMMAQVEAANRAVAGVSTADELAKLQQLKSSGVLTDAEYEAIKQKTLAG